MVCLEMKDFPVVWYMGQKHSPKDLGDKSVSISKILLNILKHLEVQNEDLFGQRDRLGGMMRLFT